MAVDDPRDLREAALEQLRVDELLDRRRAPEARRELEDVRAVPLEAALDAFVERDVGAAEPINRLLRISDEEQLPIDDACAIGISLVGVVRR